MPKLAREQPTDTIIPSPVKPLPKLERDGKWPYNLGMTIDVSVLLAVVAAAGVAFIWIAIASPRTVGFDVGTRQQKRGSFLDKYRLEFESVGLNISFQDFVRVSLIIALVIFIVLTLLGYVILGIVLAAITPIVFYQFLIDRRDKIDRDFRRMFSNVIINFSSMLTIKGSVEGAISALASEGDEYTKALFTRIIKSQSFNTALIEDPRQDQQSMQAKSMRDVLIEISREKPDIYWSQFFRLLADTSVKGGDIRHTLESLAKAQREFAAILSQIEAQQASTRLASVLYGPAPVVFLVVFSIIGDPTVYRAFYQTTAGLIAQAIVAVSGIIGWVLARRLGRRGLYVEKTVSITRSKNDIV